MIPCIRWALLLVLIHLCNAQNSRSYDTNDWIPITPNRDKPEEQTEQKKATGRVLNLAESPNQKNFFPDEYKPKKAQKVHQYLRETTPSAEKREKYTSEDYDSYSRPLKQHLQPPPEPETTQYVLNQPAKQKYYIIPKQEAPQDVQPITNQQLFLQQQQLLAAQQLLSQPVQQYDQINQYQIVTPTQVYQQLPQRYAAPFNTSKYQHVSDEVSVPSEVAPATTQLKEDKEVVQLLYVPVESLSERDQAKPQQKEETQVVQQPPTLYKPYKFEIPPTHPEKQRAPPTDQRKQHQLDRIQNDFIHQALEAHKLQAQLQHGQVPVAYYPTPQASRTVVRKRKPHQPPLALFMEADRRVHVSDVLEELKNAETIAVQDNIGPDSPKVFIGPSTLELPAGYAKFELPYLSSIENNRIQRKVENHPFFVAPLSYKTPPGYSKIPLPSPHVGSVVVNRKEEKPTSTVRPTYYSHAATDPIKAYRYETTPKPTTERYRTYFHENPYDLEPVDGLFENQASRKNPVSLTVRNRQPTTSEYEYESTSVKPAKVTEDQYFREAPTTRRTTPVRTTPHVQPEEITQRPVRIRPSYSEREEVPKRQKYRPEEEVTERKPSREETYRRQPTRPSFEDAISIKQVPVKSEEEISTRRQPTRVRVSQEEPSTKKSPYDPDLGYEQELFASRGRVHIPSYYHEPTFEEFLEEQRKPSRIKEFGPPNYEYITSSQKPQPKPNVESYEEDERKPEVVKPKEVYNNSPRVETASQYRFISTTPAYKAIEETTSPKYYVQTTEAIPTRSSLEDTRYTTLEEFSVNQKPVTSTFVENPEGVRTQPVYSDVPTSRIPTQRYPVTQVLDENTYKQILNSALLQYSSSTRAPQTELPQHSNVKEVKRPAQYREQYKTSPEDDAHGENYNFSPQLPPINPVLPGLINNLQDQALKPLLVPQLLSPTSDRVPEVKTQELATAEDPSSASYSTTSSTTPEPTTEAITNKRQRSRHRNGSRFTTAHPDTSYESTTSRRGNTRGRRPVHRSRPESHRQDNEEHASTTEYAPVRNYEHTTESRKHITHSPRQRFRNRGRPVHSDEEKTSHEETQSKSQEESQPPPPHSYIQYEQGEAKEQQVAQRVGKLDYEEPTSKVAHKVTTESSYENTKPVMDVRVTHPVTQAPKKSWIDDYSYNVDSAESLHNDYHHETTTPRSTTPRGRSRGRGRQRASSTTTSTTVRTTTTTKRTTTSTTEKPQPKEEEPEEFYGFIRPPSFNAPPPPLQVKVEPKTEPPRTYSAEYIDVPRYTTQRSSVYPQEIDLGSFYSSRNPSSTENPNVQFFEVSGVADKDGIHIFTNDDYIASTSGRLTGEVRPKVVSEAVDQQHLAATAQPVRYVEESSSKATPIETPKPKLRAPQRRKPSQNSAENYDYRQSSEEVADANEQQSRNKVAIASRQQQVVLATEVPYVRNSNLVSDSYGQPVTNDLPSMKDGDVSDSYGNPVTNSNSQRSRGKVHFQLPENLKQQSREDEDVEGGNYPSTFFKKQNTPTQQTPSFQITVDPEESEIEYDQVPHSSIQRPNVVLPNDEKNKELAGTISSTDVEASENKEETTIKPNVEATSSTTEAEKTTKKRRRGTWKLVKQRPVDNFETAESQNYPTALVNSLSINDKTPYQVDNDEKLANNATNQNTTESILDSLYEMFGVSSSKSTEASGEEPIDTSTDIEEVASTTVQPEDLTQEASTEPVPTTSNAPTEASVEPWQMKGVYTTTSTEISHGMEICYKGRCVKSSSSTAPAA